MALVIIATQAVSQEKDPFPLRGEYPKLQMISTEDFVAILEKGAVPKEKVLVLDNVGKQVRWLQYYLEKEGVSNYSFLKGGVR